ncbi:MAG: hypothetical protein IPM82_16750 [Saprospiraceae bacterium]|nr:hypothetical protein [Saprospiraceae bacterium]
MEEDLSNYQPHSDQSLLTVMNQQDLVELTIVTEPRLPFCKSESRLTTSLPISVFG